MLQLNLFENTYVPPSPQTVNSMLTGMDKNYYTAFSEEKRGHLFLKL